MANKFLFSSIVGRLAPATDTRNFAGGRAYQLTPKQALAQYAATGCMNSTFYADAASQMDTIIALAPQVEPEFLARLALYARSQAHMKDVPALLVALLSVLSPGLMAEVFDRVIDSPKMLRNFVQIIRSGRVGRKSLGSLPKRVVQQWLEQRSDEQLFRGSIGAKPSLADIIKMVHPKPSSASRSALFAAVIGQPHDENALPELVQSFNAFRAGVAAAPALPLPDVPMDMLTDLPLTREHWKDLAARVSWQALRMNLNTFARHGVFESLAATKLVASRLKSPSEIASARVLPYQLMSAFTNVDPSMPVMITNALQEAMEIAITNVPGIDGKVWVLPDISGSMHAPVTGHRKGSTTKVRCIDVAALVAAALVRKNPEAGVLPFASDVVPVAINPHDSVMTNAKQLASLPSGGTNCSAPLHYLNKRKMKGDLVIFVSDNESWMDDGVSGSIARGTETMKQWEIFKANNPQAKLVCLDLQPNATTQASSRADVLNVGGFSDAVFQVISQFSTSSLSPDHWVSIIERETI